MVATGRYLRTMRRFWRAAAPATPSSGRFGANAFGFAGHPGLKVAMIEDLIMEFEEAPADPAPALRDLRAAQRTIEDALVPIMTGLVQMTGLMRPDPA